MTRYHLMRAITLASTLAIASIANAQEADTFVFQLEWVPTGEHAPYYAGAAKGFFKEQGIDISFVRGNGGSDAANRIGAGNSPLGISTMTPVMVGRSTQDLPITAVASIYTEAPQAVLVLESSGIGSLGELAGKRVATTAGNEHVDYLKEVSKKADLDFDSIEWVVVDPTALGPMLLSKQVDGATMLALHQFYQDKAAAAIGEKVKALRYSDYGFNVYSQLIAANDAVIRDNPDLVRRTVAALEKSFIWSNENQSEACDLFVAQQPEVTHEDCVGSLSAAMTFVFNDHFEQHGFGAFNPDLLKYTWEVTAEIADINPASWDPANSSTAEFLP
ncbi:ABC transporter substrate-binding protein [Aureimonas altamirensis]|uniref:ABC transporter substrate-binding protein n=1 Tax=Aureimonas altamirensis TaxID=370622 RepID=UPI001E39BF82|nr:ABC transporter substrate-binding protein [Aureimonas altamirensis]UHD46432.1 ABC transporter substrate-binding protein [Aureimonas altamirensis]